LFWQEEVQRTKETHANSQSTYEKEVRRARKEAFKSSSALVKMQEELKSARNKYTLMREEVDVQRRKVDAKEQETFAAQNMLVDLQEEIDRLRQQNKVVEGQRDALKTALKGEEIARIATEGAIGLPATADDDEFASPKKISRHRHRESLKENMDPQAPELEDQLLALYEEIRTEKRMRMRADEQVHFMKMECQFQCCSCRVAEKQGVEYVHDDSLATQMGRMAAKIVDEYVPAPELVLEQQEQRPSTPQARPSQERETSEPAVNFSPTTGTFHKATPSPTKPAPSTAIPSSRPSPPPAPSPEPQLPTTPNSPVQEPQTPRPRPLPLRTISRTTTSTIRLKDPIDIPPPAPMTPGGISREEALEQIRQRRGRARSIAAGNGTPRGRMGEGEGRRDVSAPGWV